MAENGNIDSMLRLMGQVRTLFWGILALYLFFRKKIRTFLHVGIALITYSLVSYLFHGISYNALIWVLICFLILSLIFSHKELSSLDASGNTAREILRPDWIDWLIGMSLLICWTLLRIFVFDK